MMHPISRVYNVLEGIFDLDLNIFGPGARIGHVTFSSSIDEILQPGFVRYGKKSLNKHFQTGGIFQFRQTCPYQA